MAKHGKVNTIVEAAWGTDWRDSMKSRSRRSAFRGLAAALVVLMEEMPEDEARSIYATKPSTWGVCKRIVKIAIEGNCEFLKEALKEIKGQGVFVINSEITERLENPVRGEEKKSLSYADALLEFVTVLSPEALHKAWKAQAALESTDRPGCGNEERGKRLNELWNIIKSREGLR